jgi:hypothetical protein
MQLPNLMLAYCLLSIANWFTLLSPKQLTNYKKYQGDNAYH